jgi:hypothetical protein
VGFPIEKLQAKWGSELLVGYWVVLLGSWLVLAFGVGLGLNRWLLGKGLVLQVMACSL